MQVDEGFEAWAQAEVKRLRDRADVLEASLAMYGEARSTDAAELFPRAAPRPADDGTTSPRKARRTSQKGRNAPLMKAIEAAGAAGMTTDQVHDTARRLGMTSNRTAIRSFLWNQKYAGRLVTLENGRHVVPAHAGAGSPSSPHADGGGDGQEA